MASQISQIDLYDPWQNYIDQAKELRDLKNSIPDRITLINRRAKEFSEVDKASVLYELARNEFPKFTLEQISFQESVLKVAEKGERLIEDLQGFTTEKKDLILQRQIEKIQTLVVEVLEQRQLLEECIADALDVEDKNT
jgi:hypothetical protein